MDSNNSVQIMLGLLKSEDRTLRYFAARTLMRISLGARQAEVEVALTNAAKEDESSQVRSMAAYALRVLRGEIERTYANLHPQFTGVAPESKTEEKEKGPPNDLTSDRNKSWQQLDREGKLGHF